MKKLKILGECLIGLGLGNITTHIIRYAFERNIVSGILSIICSLGLIIGVCIKILSEGE